MRAFRLKQVTDEQIRKMHAEAQVTLEKYKADAKAREKEFWKHFAETKQKCNSDIAFRKKYPDTCVKSGQPRTLNPEKVEHPIR